MVAAGMSERWARELAVLTSIERSSLVANLAKPVRGVVVLARG